MAIILPVADQNNAKTESQTVVNIVLNIINTITNLSLGAAGVSAFICASMWSHRIGTALPAHIYLCVFGYCVLMAQAILCLDPHTGWARAFSYRNKKTTHYTMQILGSILAISGSILKIVDNRRNFKTAHGIFGIIAMVLTFVSLSCGVMNFLSSSNFSYNKRFFNVVHSLLGCLTISAAFMALILGQYHAGLFDYPVTNLLTVVTITALLGTLITPVLYIQRSLLNK